MEKEKIAFIYSLSLERVKPESESTNWILIVIKWNNSCNFIKIIIFAYHIYLNNFIFTISLLNSLPLPHYYYLFRPGVPYQSLLLPKWILLLQASSSPWLLPLRATMVQLLPSLLLLMLLKISLFLLHAVRPGLMDWWRIVGWSVSNE